MLVLDVSAAVGIVLQNGDGAASARFLSECGKAIAPELFCEEAAQVAWKYAHVGSLDKDGALSLARATIACIDEFCSSAALAEEALVEAVRLDHSFYDMLYFVLARRTGSLLVTCDRKLAKLANENNVECVELIDFA